MAEDLLHVTVRVNGTPRTLRVPARRLLSDALRHDLRLTGTHVGCEHGVCGCCTVLLDGAPVRSCLLFAVSVDGHDVTTVEGLAPHEGEGERQRAGGRGAQGEGERQRAGGRGAQGEGERQRAGGRGSQGEGERQRAGGRGSQGAGELHPIQRAFQDCHGLQCGFCTPGFIMSVAGLLADNPDPDRDEIVEGISGNLCRCTGYQNIIAAVERAAALLRDGGDTAVPRADAGAGDDDHPPPDVVATAPYAPTGDGVPGTSDDGGRGARGAGERQRAGGRGAQGAGERQRAGGRGAQGAGERQRAGGRGPE